MGQYEYASVQMHNERTPGVELYQIYEYSYCVRMHLPRLREMTSQARQPNRADGYNIMLVRISFFMLLRANATAVFNCRYQIVCNFYGAIEVLVGTPLELLESPTVRRTNAYFEVI